MMRKILLWVCFALFGAATFAEKIVLQHLQPAFWWAGMRHTEVQLLLHGKDVGKSEVSLKANGVKIANIVRPENSNYLLLYIDTEGVAPQRFHIHLHYKGTTTAVPYELKARSSQFRQTWDARDVGYLVLPDRFANGSTKNDVVKGMAEATIDPQSPTARHGGDLAGMTKHLDYLSDLGITALWHTPIFESNVAKGSYTGEAVTDYYQIDPRFGTNEDYVAFVAAAHQKGIKVVMDAVFNHCSENHFLFQDRPADDWFNFESRYTATNGRWTAVSDVHQDYDDRNLAQTGWFAPSLPDWNQGQEDALMYLIQNTIWWIEYAGIDGIRQRHYPALSLDAMSDWCRAIETEYPGFNMVGKTPLTHAVGVSYWQKDSKMAQPKNSLLPSVTDFPLSHLLRTYYYETMNDTDRGLSRLYHYLSQDAVYANPLGLVLQLSDPDVQRFLSEAAEANDFDRYRQALILLLTLRGQPVLYCGDEVGAVAMEKGTKSGLHGHFVGGFDKGAAHAFTEKGRTELQNRYFDFTRRLLQWRKTTDAVAGAFFHVAPRRGVYYYVREGAAKKAVVVMNGTNEARTVDLSQYDETSKKVKGWEVISGKEMLMGTQVELPPRGVLLFDLPNE